MKRNRILSTALAAAMFFSVGAAHLVTEAQASPDTAQLVSEDQLPPEESYTEEISSEAPSAEEPSAGEETAAEPQILPNPQLADLGLGAPSSLDSNGSIPIPQDGTLLNIRLPEYLGGEVLNAIAPGAFSGTSCLRSITLPAVISVIGENTFANCPGLAYIVLEGRFDLEGMSLGANWNGNAQVIFALIVEEVPEETEPVETEPEETEPAETEPEGTEPAETEPVETEPAETEPAETEPVETEPAETEPAETEPVETEPAETEPPVTEPPVTEPTIPQPSEAMTEETKSEESANPEL